MIANTAGEYRESRSSFFYRTAKLWQNYFDATGVLPGISPSEDQKAIIQQEEDQLLINGSAGSGKSITLMYKMLKVMKKEQESKRILYVTFGKTLVQDSFKRLQTSKTYQHLEEKKLHQVYLHTFHAMVYELLSAIGEPHLKKLHTSLKEMSRTQGNMIRRLQAIRDRWFESEEQDKLPLEQKLTLRHTANFLMDEISWMKANGFINREKYLAVERTGRSQNPRLTRQQRKSVYRIYEIYQEKMREDYQHDMDLEDYALLLLKNIDYFPEELKYDYVFVDEVQDLQPMQILALVKLTKKSIVLTGDPKQRIYKSSPHSYQSLGLHVTGRKNRTLKQNFRSTKQIMELASKLTFEDVENDRLDDQTFSQEGDLPVISYYANRRKLANGLIRQITKVYQKSPQATIAILHRDDDTLHRGQRHDMAVYLEQKFHLITTEEFGRRFDYRASKKPIFFSDVYSSKGLEFDHVFLIDFDRDHYPLQKKIEDLKKCADQEESDSYQKDYDRVYSDEKKMLYVAMTRAKSSLQLMYHGNNSMKISQFVRDFKGTGYIARGFDASRYR
ncbi:UvrD-helicase domain-containing protein [Shimazuella kribbensis]|uniref:UvrD-helicase domain-containing protein n=1 Tax=Shimazuella kribbensis TaxID=139808 RepID=UPI000422F6B9|nr:UvrD-helicase domain-containing protein [Shimazuella kribbensis]